MGRAARPQDRLPSQRERKEVRDARKEASEAARKLEIANEEKQIAHRNRNNDSKRARAAEKELKNQEPPSLSGLHGEIPRLKFQSTAFYAHVEYGYQWLNLGYGKVGSGRTKTALPRPSEPLGER